MEIRTWISEKQFKKHYWLLGIIVALALYFVTSLWVPPFNDHLPHLLYYRVNKGIMLWAPTSTRMLTGAIAHILSVSPENFVELLKFFEIAWLILLCIQIFYWIKHPIIAFILCALFVFSSSIYIANADIGFVDMAMNCWLLLAASLVVIPHSSPGPPIWRLFVASLFLYCALLTHDLAIFPSCVLIIYSILRYRYRALAMAVPWSILSGHYLWVTTLLTPSHEYLGNLLSGFNYFLLEAWSPIGMFTAGSVLWIVYVVIGSKAIRSQSNITARYQLGIFLCCGVLLNLFPLMMACDIQRVVGGIWLSVYILLVDQADQINRPIQSRGTYILWSAACIAQLLIPPTYIIHNNAIPLNCYAEKVLQIIPKDRGYHKWMPLMIDPNRCHDGGL